MAAGTPLRQRLRDWALRRQGTDTLPLRLAARRVYILPTPAGWTFAALVGVMFLAGMNYGNGLALLFTFWLAGFGVVAAVQTQRSLTGVTITAATAAPAHAGEGVMLRVAVTGRVAPEDLQLAADHAATAADPTPDAATTDAETGTLILPVIARRRGRWRAPPLLLSTTAPFGLFRTWTWLSLDIQTLVYPRAAGDLPVPDSTGDDDGDATRTQGQDELAWLREFREGDSPRQVAWKAYARGAPLLVREYHGQGARQLEFDYAALGSLEAEAKLSQLTRWIVAADARGAGWILRLPGRAPLAGGGGIHRALCLEQLALFGLPDAARGTPR